MFAFSLCEHLDYPNYPCLSQTKEDTNNNAEAQAGVASLSHNKKSFKPLNDIFCPSQAESLAHVPVGDAAFQIHTGADGNLVMAQ